LRREILDAARELFVKEGYRNVSLRKIARRIGYSPMSIYLHFADKADILDCICEETFTGFLAAADQLDAGAVGSAESTAAADSTAPRERLEAGLRTFIEFGLAHPHHYQLTFMTPPHEPLALGRREQIGQAAYQRLRTQVAASLDERQRARIDLDVASQVIWASVHGLISLLIARPDFQWQERRRLIDGVVRSATGWLGRCCAEAEPAALPPARGQAGPGKPAPVKAGPVKPAPVKPAPRKPAPGQDGPGKPGRGKAGA
jgi:AcrR family transcriptional regulator